MLRTIIRAPRALLLVGLIATPAAHAGEGAMKPGDDRSF